jgi:alpha-amylase
VTFEATGNSNVQRFPGLFTDTNVGAGFGDTSGDGFYQPQEIMSAGSFAFSTLLYSQGNAFNAAADLDGDGVVTNLDLLGLGAELVGGGANQLVLDRYDQLLVKRGDVNQDGLTNGADAAALYANFGPANWLMDLNVDGTINAADVSTLVDNLVRTSRGDFNLDRRVDGTDFLIWQRGLGAAPGRFDLGDADLNGAVNTADLAVWRASYGAVAPLTIATAATVPEPSTAVLACIAAMTLRRGATRHRNRDLSRH